MKHADKCRINSPEYTHITQELDTILCECDGFHTFNELYEHRIQIYIALCKQVSTHRMVWRSLKHSDGSSIPGWFLLGINIDPGSQITYHLPENLWHVVEQQISLINTLEKAPTFDGHTSDDVLERLRHL